MEITANRSRHNLPLLVNPNELPPALPGKQLPPTLQLPSPALLARFRTLGVHLLQTSGRQKLPKPPLALTVDQLSEREYRFRLHISPELTNDPGVCKDVHAAIATFMTEASCLNRLDTKNWLTIGSFSGDQDSKDGVGVFTVMMVRDLVAQKHLDATLGAVIQIARFVQVVDGDVNRLAELLRDPELLPHLLHIGIRLTVDGAAGQLLTEVSRPIHPGAIHKTAARLVDMGHLDLAMMVLATGIRHASSIHRGELTHAFLSLLENTPLLENDQDRKTAFDLVDRLILSNPNLAPHELEATCKRCFDLSGADDSLEIMVGVVDALGSMAYAAALFKTRAARAVLENPQRDALEAQGFKFYHACGAEGIAIEPIISNAGAGAFVPSKHGDGMAAYVDSLLRASPGLGHVRTFCLPVIVFLIDHFAQLPREARERVLALSNWVMDQAMAVLESPVSSFTLRAAPMLERAQVLMEVTVLHRLLELVLESDRPRAFNIAAWAHQNQKSLFPSLPEGAYDTILAQMHAALGVLGSDLAAHEVDVRATRAAMTLSLELTSTQFVRTLFRRAVFIHTPEASHALFQCWKALTGDDELRCHTRLLCEAQFLTGAMQAPQGNARQLVEAAWADLKTTLKRPNANLAASLELHEALINFIASVPHAERVPEWVLKTLAELADDPVLEQHLRVVKPNALAWPAWLRTQMSLGSQSSSNGCFMLLFRCAGVGAVADHRFDALFVEGIRHLVGTYRDADAAWLALQAFVIWESTPRNEDRAPLPIDLVEALVSILHGCIVVDARTGVDPQQVMVALMDQLLQGDPAAALRQLNAIQQDLPLLGVMLCVQCAEHFARVGDTVQMQRVLAKALAYRPSNQQEAIEVHRLLQAFMQSSLV